MAAAALRSNAFYTRTGLHQKPDPKPSRPALTVYAKTKISEGESKSEGSSKPKGFSFDFSKITTDAKALIPVVSSPATSLFVSPRRKDANTVFVAGATGQAGTRIAQMLLRQGFAVRAGVPELESAQELARLAATYKLISPAESKRLNAVESSFSDPESIAKAIGPATKLVVTIGPSENGPFSAVTTDDALNIVRAADLAGVGHIAIIYDSSASLPSSPSSSSTYNVLDGITSFFSNFSTLFSSSQQLSIGEFLERLVETDVRYTLIKAAIAEDHGEESGHGVVVAKEGTISESRVAKSQIAKLVADVFSNTSIAQNKVVEVSTSPSATSKPVAELFSAIPEDRRKAYAEASAKAKAEEEALITSEKAQEAAKAAKKLEEEVKKLSKQEVEATTLANEAKAKVEAAGSTLDSLLSKAKDLGGGSFSWKFSSQLLTAVPQKTEEKSKTKIATVRGQAKARSLLPQKAILKPKKTEPKPEMKSEVRNVLGGLFKQDTIYVDDD